MECNEAELSKTVVEASLLDLSHSGLIGSCGEVKAGVVVNWCAR